MLESNRQGTLFSFRAVGKGLGICHPSLMEKTVELAGRSWLHFREGLSLAETPYGRGEEEVCHRFFSSIVQVSVA